MFEPPPPPPSKGSSSEVGAGVTPVAPPPTHNPGSYEELHRKCRDIFPMCFEGAKFMVQKGLSSHFQVSYIYIFIPITCYQ